MRWTRATFLKSLLALGMVLVPSATPAQTVKAPLQLATAPKAPPAPISLTGSDGSGLELTSLRANVVVEDPLAFTELHLTFRNPEGRTREGRFRITLPPGATISRFAKRAGDRMQEGEVVEQQAARVAYEDFLHRRQDPALLETEAGNEFSARVFPIAPHGVEELIVSYSQELSRRDEPYVLPLRGLPKIDQLTVHALVKKQAAGGSAPASNLGGQRVQHEVVELDRRAFTPDRDFEVAHDGSAGRLGLRHENLVAARIVPVSEGEKRDAIASLFVLVDTSASRALGLGEDARVLRALLGEVAKAGDAPVSIAAFDQTVQSIYSGRASQVGDEVQRALTARRALGASDLDAALAWLEHALKVQKHARVLLVTDGVATAGDVAADKLRARVKALGQMGVERLDVLAPSGIRDDALLSRLVTAGLARDGVVLDAKRSPSSLSQKLTRATRSGLKLSVDGAGWIWPSVLNGVQSGDELIVYADLPRDKPLTVKVDGKPLALSGALANTERPLLERAWVKARIDRLLEQRDGALGSDRDLAEALKKQIIELSTKERVLSPFTALLVLENEQDYARFHIERSALADILTVDAHGITVLQRKDLALATATVAQPSDEVAVRADKAALQAPPPPTAEQLANMNKGGPGGAADGFGRSGIGEGGGGSSGGSGAARNASMDSASMGAPAAAPMVAREMAKTDAEREEPSASRPEPRPAEHARAVAAAPARRVAAPSQVAEEKRAYVAPLEGELKTIRALLDKGTPEDKKNALAHALAWRERDPGDVLALIALGEAWEALGDRAAAERAYGSIIDLFPGRADLRRFAGERLEHIKSAAALALAVDTYRKAADQRPDHPASHRLLGFALVKQGRLREAFEAVLRGVKQTYPEGRFRGVDQILREDLGLVAAAWMKDEPKSAQQIEARLKQAGGSVENAPSLRFVLNWETDANDVDFHIHDKKGGHAFFSQPHLPSGGDLYADVTTGYGPECFTIRGAASQRAYPYRLQAHYYSRGPMGYGMGKLQIIDHDGHGNLRFEERPFVVMQDGAFVDLGSVKASVQTLAVAK